VLFMPTAPVPDQRIGNNLPLSDRIIRRRLARIAPAIVLKTILLVIAAEIVVMCALARHATRLGAAGLTVADAISLAVVIAGPLYIIIVRPVSRLVARTAAAAAEQRFEALVNAAPLPIIWIGQQGEVKAWNPVTTQVFGLPERDALGRQLHRLWPGGSGAVRELQTELLRGEIVHSERALPREGGDRLDIGLWAAPLVDANGDADGALVIAVDRTDSRRVNEELRREKA
jgi:PAS domain S-box-containing protein